MSSSPVTLEYKGRIAIITINNEKKANALTQDQYYILATHMREVATHDEVFITLLTAKGILFPIPSLKHTTNP
jgi:peroxisomal 3,2-trans-enoyl-CoA isomerase